MNSNQYEIHLPRNHPPDTPDPKLIFKAFQDAKLLGDDEEAERLLERWRSLQPRRPGEHE